jgi:hypothetical protein
MKRYPMLIQEESVFLDTLILLKYTNEVRADSVGAAGHYRSVTGGGPKGVFLSICAAKCPIHSEVILRPAPPLRPRGIFMSAPQTNEI